MATQERRSPTNTRVGKHVQAIVTTCQQILEDVCMWPADNCRMQQSKDRIISACWMFWRVTAASQLSCLVRQG